MVDCALRGLCHTSINNYVSGINLLSKLNGGKDLREDFGVGLTLQGLRRILGSETKPKDPIMPQDLSKVFQQVNLSDHRELSIWIGVLLCFRTLIRKCHLFPTHQSMDHYCIEIILRLQNGVSNQRSRLQKLISLNRELLYRQ